MEKQTGLLINLSYLLLTNENARIKEEKLSLPFWRVGGAGARTHGALAGARASAEFVGDGRTLDIALGVASARRPKGTRTSCILARWRFVLSSSGGTERAPLRLAETLTVLVPERLRRRIFLVLLEARTPLDEETWPVAAAAISCISTSSKPSS